MRGSVMPAAVALLKVDLLLPGTGEDLSQEHNGVGVGQFGND